MSASETLSTGAALPRRRFLADFALSTAALGSALGAGVTAFAPDWGDGAPVRPTRALPALPSIPELPPAPPPVRTYTAAVRRDWLAFRHRFVTPEGRVIDTGNRNASHSEGQGWALMAAQAADDPDTFATVLDWTAHNLRRRPYDSLHAWRYRPGEANPVQDLNNATDGDLYIAAALARAAHRWDRPDYARQASRLARDILGMVKPVGARTVLLPAASGFDKPDSVTVNLSYYAFGLFPDLAALAPSPHWDALLRDGIALVLQARYGRWKLPPDWVRVDRGDGALCAAPGWPPRFSWDAIRIPLHLAWAGVEARPFLDAFRQYWNAVPGRAPAWANLSTGELAPYAAPAGIRAVAALALRGDPLDAAPPFPSIMAAEDYYGAGLVLLSRIAMEDGSAAFG